MEVQFFNDKIPFTVIDNFYTVEEQNEMMVELNYLAESRRMIPPFRDSGSAGSPEEKLKNASCQYLDSFFLNREHSSILTITEKLFENSEKIIDDHPHWSFDCSDINQHFTQVVYYEDKQEYKPHRDTARFTALTYFYNEPKQFSGGNLRFDDYDIEIECIKNRVIIFPSVLRHASTPIKMMEQSPSKHGKFCITQFLHRRE